MNLASRLLLVAGAVALMSCSYGAAASQDPLDLPVEEFNAIGRAWRSLEAQEDFLAAGDMLEAYVRKHAGSLREDQVTLLHFHAAQMFAFAGDTSRALEHMPQAKFKVEPAEWPRMWNDYVAATEAFLRRDRESLISARTRILSGPKVDGVPLNLHVVDSLIEHYDKSYYVAYSKAKGPPNKTVDPTPGSAHQDSGGSSER